MVRVNHPPGGKVQLHDAPAPEPKTVRVLKPPGGGSSISFGEDDSTAKSTKANPPAAKPASPTPTPSPPSVSPAPPPTEDKTPSEAPKDNSFPSPVGEPTSAPNGESKPAVPEAKAPAETSKSNGHQSSDDTKETTVKQTNGTVNGSHPEPAQSPTEHNGDSSTTDGTVQKVSDDVKDLSISKPTLRLNINNSTPKTETSDTTACNSKTPSLSTCSSSSPTPTSPSIASPTVRQQGDTRDRLFGQVPTTPTSELSSRKIKDHMRSSIFGHDDQLPSKSSSANSGTTSNGTHQQAAPAPAPAPASAPAQRQRIPPGGFSSKLW